MARFHRRDEGFALVTVMAILAVLALLLVVALTAGNAAFTNSERGARWTKTLAVAEAGANDAVTQIAQNRAVDSPCPIDPSPTSVPCAVAGGEYQWSRAPAPDRPGVVVTAVGYYPTRETPQVTRAVQVLLEPESSFRYALFSASTLEIKNDSIVNGDVYSRQAVLVNNNAVICGSILNTEGGVTIGVNAQILKANGTCSGKDGRVWAGGTINMAGAFVEGDATASALSSVTCPPSPSTDYALLGGTVGGTATACGQVTASSPNPVANTLTDPPAAQSLPGYTFDPANYPGASCFAVNPSTCSQDPANWSATAVSQFNNTVSKANMQGTYVIWQSNPGPGAKVNLDGLSLSGDLTIVTNAPIDLGNTSSVSSTVAATLTIITLYVPPDGTVCSDNKPEYCSVYAQNTITIDDGDPANPDDGIALLLYTPGKMSFKNTGGQNSNGEGALYAGSMDIKNGFDVTYNGRIERILGFGVGMQQTLWQEIPQ